MVCSGFYMNGHKVGCLFYFEEANGLFGSLNKGE